MDLWEAVGASGGDVLSLIGAGGKTTALLTLAQQAGARGLKTLVTSTTRMWLPNLPVIYSNRPAVLDRELERAFLQQRVISAGAGEQDGKLVGLAPDTVCSVKAAQVTLCEADGAAGRSLKIHRPGEPVVPACTTILVVVAGLDAVGSAFDEVAHPDTFSAEYFGQPASARVRDEHVVGALLEGADFCPPSSSLTFILNKAEGGERLQNATRIAERIRTHAPDARILLVSRGHVLDAPDELGL